MGERSGDKPGPVSRPNPRARMRQLLIVIHSNISAKLDDSFSPFNTVPVVDPTHWHRRERPCTNCHRAGTKVSGDRVTVSTAVLILLQCSRQQGARSCERCVLHGFACKPIERTLVRHLGPYPLDRAVTTYMYKLPTTLPPAPTYKMHCAYINAEECRAALNAADWSPGQSSGRPPCTSSTLRTRPERTSWAAGQPSRTSLQSPRSREDSRRSDHEHNVGLVSGRTARPFLDADVTRTVPSEPPVSLSHIVAPDRADSVSTAAVFVDDRTSSTDSSSSRLLSSNPVCSTEDIVTYDRASLHSVSESDLGVPSLQAAWSSEPIFEDQVRHTAASSTIASICLLHTLARVRGPATSFSVADTSQLHSEPPSPLAPGTSAPALNPAATSAMVEQGPLRSYGSPVPPLEQLAARPYVHTAGLTGKFGGVSQELSFVGAAARDHVGRSWDSEPRGSFTEHERVSSHSHEYCSDRPRAAEHGPAVEPLSMGGHEPVFGTLSRSVLWPRSEAVRGTAEDFHGSSDQVQLTVGSTDAATVSSDDVRIAGLLATTASITADV